MSPPDKITLTLHLEREERESILVRRPQSEAAPIWLPISKIEVAPERTSGRLLMVTLPLWLAKDKGLVAVADPNQGRLF